jgi:hypothetical protein
MAGCFAATLVSSLFPVSGAFVDRLCLSFIKAFIHPKKKNCITRLQTVLSTGLSMHTLHNRYDIKENKGYSTTVHVHCCL